MVERLRGVATDIAPVPVRRNDGLVGSVGVRWKGGCRRTSCHNAGGDDHEETDFALCYAD